MLLIMLLIDEDSPVELSKIWDLQADYYAKAGPAAWNNEVVPQGPTANCYTADVYAGVVAGFFRDLRSASDDRVPLIIELGAGSGSFAWKFLNRLRRFHLIDDLQGRNFEYLITDAMSRNVENWRKTHRLRDFARKGFLRFGRLDVAVGFRIETDDGVLTAETLRDRPVILIANYFFDTIPCDLLRVRDGALDKALITLTAEDDALSNGTVQSWQKVKADFAFKPLGDTYAHDEAISEVLERYTGLPDGTFVSVPTVGLKLLETFVGWRAPILMLAGGLGFTHPREFGKADPFILDTYFAYYANFHMIAQYIERLGGTAHFQRHTDPDFFAGAFTLPVQYSQDDFTNTKRAARDLLYEFDPYDAYNLLGMIGDGGGDASFRQIYACLRFSKFDPAVASSCLRNLFELMHHTDATYDRRQLCELYSEAYQAFFPVSPDPTFDLGVTQLFLAAKLNDEALELIEDSLVEFGRTAKRLYVLALVLLRHERHEEARASLQEAMRLDPNFGPAHRLYEDKFTAKLQPAVSPIAHLMVQARSEDAPERAKAIYDRDGAVVLENLFSAHLIDRMRAAFDERYENWRESLLGKPNTVGNKRVTIPLRMQAPFNDPEFFAPKLLIDLLTYAMGVKPILNAWGAIVTYPGARTQHVHREHPLLFQTDEANKGLPTTAVTVLVPLIDLNEALGGTQLWEGSHRLGVRNLWRGQPSVVYSKAGTALVFDYRVYHGGMPCTADVIRPTLFISYSQPWFRDTLAFQQHAALGLTELERAAIPEEHRDMFRFAAVLREADEVRLN